MRQQRWAIVPSCHPAGPLLEADSPEILTASSLLLYWVWRGTETLACWEIDHTLGRIQTEKHVLAKHEPLNFEKDNPFSGTWKKAVLWANLKLDILIPHVMQFHTLLFKLYYLIHWPCSRRYLHIHPLIELKTPFETQLIFSLVF